MLSKCSEVGVGESRELNNLLKRRVQHKKLLFKEKNVKNYKLNSQKGIG